MENIITLIKSEPDYIGSNGRTNKEIKVAERELGCKFAKDYREYLKEIGLACFDGRELTGLTKNKRLDVVSVTKEQRNIFGENTKDWYVVEETNIDGIVIWQNTSGAVYKTIPNSEPYKIADSLSEYFAE